MTTRPGTETRPWITWPAFRELRTTSSFALGFAAFWFVAYG